MEVKFLFQKFKEHFNKRNEINLEIIELEKDKYFLKDVEKKYEFTIDEKFNFYFNSEKIYFQDIKIKKGIFSKTIEIKGRKLKLSSKKEVDYLEIFIRNIFFLNKNFDFDKYFHSLVENNVNFKEKYLIDLKERLLEYSLDYIYIYKYLLEIGMSMRFTKNEMDRIFIENISLTEGFSFKKNKESNFYFMNDFYSFFFLFNFELLKNGKNIDPEENKKVRKIVNWVYKYQKAELKKVYKTIPISEQEKYFFIRQLYSNILKINDIKNMEGFNMEDNKEKREFTIQFIDGNREICRYTSTLVENDDNKKTDFEYLENLKEKEDVVLKYTNHEVPFNEALKYLSEETDKIEKNRIKEKNPNIDKILRNINFKEEEFIDFPEIIIRDITEEKILGFKDIGRETLKDIGVWFNQGKRIIEMKLTNILDYFQEQKSYDIDLKLYLSRIGNRILEEKEILETTSENNLIKENTDNDFIFNFEIDTNSIYEKVKEELEENKHKNILFDIEISFKSNIKNFKISTPLEIKFKLASKYLNKDKIIIDFGTSSTCIAYTDGIGKMISLEKPETMRERAYENPTNFMINNWEEFYSKWIKGEQPNIVRMEGYWDKEGEFYQGHKLREIESEAPREMLNAILDKIKLLPYRLLKLNEKPTFRPVIDNNKDVNLISGTVMKEGKYEFKPIVAYSYLLARNTMYPVRESAEGKEESISVKYRMTVPTKFDKEVRDKIREDIETGLKLAAPTDIRDNITVEIGNEEPVAFVGAMILKKELQVGDKFAVIDFGGGTLDFSFGMYRKATEEEEEENEVGYVLEIFNTDGDDRGGAEYLINKLSYLIYRENSEQLKNMDIPFIVPHDEEKIDYFNEKLLTGRTSNAYLNLKKFNENISRRIFEGKPGDSISINQELELKDINNKTVKIKLDVDIPRIEECMEESVENICNTFMELIKRDLPNFEDLKIFRAGNASRSAVLERILNEKVSELGNIPIIFIDEPRQDGIKPKTAVVLGEVNLSARDADIMVIYNNKVEGKENEVPFEFYVGKQDDEGSSDFKELIHKGDIDKKWKKYGRVSRESYEIRLLYTNVNGVKTIDDTRLRHQILNFNEDEMLESKTLWIRPDSSNKMEYVFYKKEPDVSVEGKIIEIKRY